MRFLPFDEINALTTIIKKNPRSADEEDLIEMIMGVLIMSYDAGLEDVEEMLGLGIKDDITNLSNALDKEYDGKTWEDRVHEYYEKMDGESIARVIDTETHRVYNQAILNISQESGLELNKTWKTMKDNRVRETHFYLEGMKIGLNEKFYTYDGDSAMFPGDFEKAENNCNCRCYISVSEE